MKTCPNCGMNVEAYSQCPICDHDITNEPQSEKDVESYRLNAYFFRYLGKKHKFSLACSLLVLAGLFFSAGRWDYWQIIAVFLTAAMWVQALWKNFVFKMFGSIYSDNYLEATHKIGIYACGIFAVAASVL